MPFEEGKCGSCQETVYLAERIIFEGQHWHKHCFNCMTCGKKLDSTNAAAHEDKVYCKYCHFKNFGPKGYSYGGGAGALTREGL